MECSNYWGYGYKTQNSYPRSRLITWRRLEVKFGRNVVRKTTKTTKMRTKVRNKINTHTSLQHYWNHLEYSEGSWRLEETCCYSTSGGLINSLVWMVALLPLIFNSSCLIFSSSLWGTFQVSYLHLVSPSHSYHTVFSALWQDPNIRI